MKKNNKFLALALGTVLSLSMLAGCGDSADTETPAADGTEAPAADENGGQRAVTRTRTRTRAPVPVPAPFTG